MNNSIKGMMTQAANVATKPGPEAELVGTRVDTLATIADLSATPVYEECQKDLASILGKLGDAPRGFSLFQEPIHFVPNSSLAACPEIDINPALAQNDQGYTRLLADLAAMLDGSFAPGELDNLTHINGRNYV